MRLVIVRHGTRDDTDNPEKYAEHTQHNNCPLSENGFKLCAVKAAQLKELLGETSLDAIYASPFLRTLQTAEEYQKVFSESKIERHWEISEGHNFHEPTYSKEFHEEILAAGIKSPETIPDIVERCQNFLKKLPVDEETTIMLSTHGIIYNLLLQELVPSYRFDPGLRAEDYVPRYCDTTILLTKNAGESWSVEYSDLEALSKSA